MKTLLKCHCGHAYFEGEGCRGCYYDEFPHKRKLDSLCISDGYEPFKKTQCKFCPFRIVSLRIPNFCSKDCKMSLIEHKRETFCSHCGKKIQLPTKKYKYCSKDCRAIQEKKNARLKYLERIKTIQTVDKSSTK